MSLIGKHIVNTRAIAQAESLDQQLIALGAIPISYPCIAIQPPDDSTALDHAIEALSDYDYLVFTSANAVIAFADHLAGRGLPPIRIATVGTATATALQRHLGVAPDLIPSQQHAEALGDQLPITPKMRILIPESLIARPTLADRLRDRGAWVTVIPAYTTVIGSGGVRLSDHLQAGQIDAITLTSSSTAENLIQRLESEGGDRALLTRVGIVCIGAQTAHTARHQGLRVDRVATIASLEGLIAALTDYFEGNTG